MRNLTLTTKQWTRTADLLEKAAIAALVAILGSDNPSFLTKFGGGGLALTLAIMAVRVERGLGRRR